MSYFQFYLWWCFSTWFGLLSQGKYSKEWDAELNTLLDKYGESARVDEYTCIFGNKEVWISNALYCYGHDVFGKCKRNGYRTYALPSIRTMYRLWLCCEWVRDGKPSHD